MHTAKLSMPRAFNYLNLSQALGAFNDNLFKLLTIFLLVAIHGPRSVTLVSAIAGAVFVAPFMLLSPVAGLLADRFDKRRVFQALKVTEILVMALGLVFFAARNTVGLYAVLFLMSAQSALLGPARLGLLPEIVGEDRLTRANGLSVAASYLAIILGTGAAAVVSLLAAGSNWIAAASCVGVATIGAWAALRIGGERSGGRSEPCREGLGRNIVSAVKMAVRDRPLGVALAAKAGFLFVAAFVQLSILPYGMLVLGLTREQSSALFLLTALGVGAGALLCGALSRGYPQLGLAPIGGVAMAACGYAMAAANGGLITVMPGLVLLGLFAGLYIVPLNALVQLRSPVRHRGAVLALGSLLDFTGVLAASGVVWLLGRINAPATAYFTVFVTGALALSALTVIGFGRSVVKTLVTGLMAPRYRIRTLGATNLPSSGPAVVAFNHVSWIDALLVMAAMDRPVRFLMARNIYRKPHIRPLAKLAGAIPVSYTDGPHALQHSLADARRVLARGEVLGIFPEAGISPHGFMLSLRKGYRLILDGIDAPLIPAHIDGAWGSSFSYYGGRLFSRRPSIRRRRITVNIGTPLPAGIPPWRLRQRMEELGAETLSATPRGADSLAHAFVKTARRRWFAQAMNDTTGKRLSFGKALIGSIALARLLRRRLPERMVGVMLPASVGGVLTNVALTLAGKIPVNLNFTASRQALDSAARQCELRTVITSRRFLAKLDGCAPPAPPLYLEELAAAVSGMDRLRAMVAALLAPARMLAPRHAAGTPATIVFSSGSTAEPKGIVLAHENILGNIESMRRAIAVEPHDTICAALPLFHSFGYTATMWFPLIAGFRASYHPNPLDAAAVAGVVRNNRATILLATPTFLRSYIRKATREDFSSLRLVIAGAEKLRGELAEQFEQRFGIKPLEGYGATELSPVVSLNVPDTPHAGRVFRGNKPGSIGRTLPGVVARVVDPDTGAELGPDQAGLLLVKGPNVMQGYLGKPGKTAEVLRDGWYVTGDIAAIDTEGFITLTDRLSRFSKIAGEMAPHCAVEDAIMRALGAAEPVVVATAVPDAARGERIALLYTPEAGTEDDVMAAVMRAEIPNLWKPSRETLVPVDTIPMLATGKTDLRRVKETASNWVKASCRAAA